MLSSATALLATGALALAGVPAAPGGTMIWVPLCHGGAVPLHLPDDRRHAPAKPCPFGCHAAGAGRREDASD